MFAQTYVLVAEFVHQRDQFWKSPRHRKQSVFLSRKVEANLLFVLLLHFQLPSLKVHQVFLQRTFNPHAQSQSVLVLPRKRNQTRIPKHGPIMRDLGPRV